MLDEQFLHANAEPGGGDKLEKKKDKMWKNYGWRKLSYFSNGID